MCSLTNVTTYNKLNIERSPNSTQTSCWGPKWIISLFCRWLLNPEDQCGILTVVVQDTWLEIKEV